MLSEEASTSPKYLTSPPLPASAIATAFRSFAASIPTKASPIRAMARPPLKRTHSYPGGSHRANSSELSGRTCGLTIAQHGVQLNHRLPPLSVVTAEES